MFRDQEEELQRLQQELLAQEEPETEEEDEDLLEDAELDALLKDTRPSEDRMIYQNYSNGYGKDLRNYASGYQAYNTDNLDTDLDEFSRQVREPQRKNGPLVAAMLLAVAILVVVCWILWRYWGLLQ